MSERLSRIVEALREVFSSVQSRGLIRNAHPDSGKGRLLAGLVIGGLVIGTVVLVKNPPMQGVSRDEIGVRTNILSGQMVEFRDGAVLTLPGMHRLDRYPLREQLYGVKPGEASFQTIEGLSIGLDFSVRYALDPKKQGVVGRIPPEAIGREIVEPQVRGVLNKVLAAHTARDIFSGKRQAIQNAIEAELRDRLAADGIVLRGLVLGKVDLPADYRARLEKMLAEEMEAEKMRYTLELKTQQIKQNELEAEAEKVRREKAAEAAGNEQVIAAKAQAEAMKHILPFKQKQIEQRQLEAEAEKVSRIKNAEASAQARKIEAEGEAASRQKLADAEVYRLEKVAKTSSDQLERDGATITRNPLLVQKALADKLSDKISVIIAPPPTDGSFIAGALLGGGHLNKVANPAAASPAARQAAAKAAANGDGEE